MTGAIYGDKSGSRFITLNTNLNNYNKSKQFKTLKNTNL